MSSATAMPRGQRGAAIVDAHVHIYDCFDVASLLDGAVANFADAAERHDVGDYRAFLMLSETASDHAFARLAGAPPDSAVAGPRWRISTTAERETLIARRDDGAELTLIAGRQIVTSEKLEILALGTVATFEDGQTADDSLEAVARAGALAVLPWGVGKWWGSRGALVDRLLAERDPSLLLLGDNSGRPWFLPRPPQFDSAVAGRRRILPGSDPLPFAREANRVGGVGSIVATGVPTTAPAAALKRLLPDASTSITRYMRLESIVPFLRNQVGMQMRNRARR